MQNSNSNTNPPSNHPGPLEWAKRFVPLPPTEFPDEVAVNNVINERPTMEPETPPESPLNNASLPCLQDIAGVDPFFTPMQTPQFTPPVSESSAVSPQHHTATDQHTEQAERNDAAVPPQVEIIGQQVEQDSVPTTDDHASSPALGNQQESHQEQDQNSKEAEVVKKTGLTKPTVEIHEYDLATKVDSTSTVEGSQEPNLLADGSNTVASTEPDIASYWSQDNVSSFVPGITPIEAYPVCQEYAEQISVSGESKSITLSDIQLEQALLAAANLSPDAAFRNLDDLEASQSDSEAIATTVESCDPETESTVPPNVVPLQADPFAGDTFERSLDLDLVKSTNQFSKQALPPSIADNTEEEAWTAGLETQNPDLVVPETPNLAARQVETPSATDYGTATTETTDSQPEHVALAASDQLPEVKNENEVCQVSSSNDLFQSVEKSLSDLQTINHYDSNEFSPAASALDVFSAIPTSTESPIEPANADQSEDVVEQLPAPTFEPIDLTAHLPSVQAEAEPRQPAEPEFSQGSLAVEQAATATLEQSAETSEMSSTLLSEEQTTEQDQQSEEPATELAAPEPESDWQTIQVDGEDGYDFIDLKAFNVAHASFCPGKILLDDGQTKFEIQYRNLNLAVFADDFEVELA